MRLLLPVVAASAAILAACEIEPLAKGPITQDELSIDTIEARANSGMFRSADDVLAALPDEEAGSFVLMETSASLQRSDLHHPRVVFFGPDARLILAFGTDPTDPNYETVEMIEADEETGDFRFERLRFGGQGPMIEHADACTSCHGETPRPIWGAYPSWPGAFGPQDGELTEAQTAALEEIAATPEHRANRAVLGLDSSSYHLSARRYGYPNTTMGFEVGARVAWSLFARVRTSPNYLRYAPAYLAERECHGEEFDDVLEEMRSTIEKEAPGHASVTDGVHALWGLDPLEDFQLQLSAKAPLPAEPQSWNEGSTSLDDLVRFLVLRDLQSSDPTLAAPFASVAAKSDEMFHYGWELRGSERAVALAKDDYVDAFYLDPFRTVFNAALGEGGASPEREAFCQALAMRWRDGG